MAAESKEHELKVCKAFVTFTCENCGTPQDETDLFYCGICNSNHCGIGKAAKILCNVCGRLNHKRKKHGWNEQPQTVNGLSHRQNEIETQKMVRWFLMLRLRIHLNVLLL